MRVLDLFSGIGGFSLGLERAGMKTVAFCEIEEYPRRVLAKHWPDVPIYDDVRTLTADTLRRDGVAVDVICGGFPCTDISLAGKGAGIDGEQSGLWKEYARIIGDLRPRFVVVENVAALLARGLGTVLADLAAVGYDAEWDCIPASAVGAPHRRDRIWLVAYPNSQSESDVTVDAQPGPGLMVPRGVGDSARGPRDASPDARPGEHQGRERSGADRGPGSAIGGPGWWDVEPDVGRVAHGVPARVDRLRSLGNALVPQIAEWIGHRIIAHEGGLAA